jgi:OOP family OmpA-OmpF porin
LQEQEENWQLDDIAACRKKFDDAIKALKDVERLKAQPYVVYFTLNSAKLQGDALAVIKEAAIAFKAAKAARADIAGHADTSGKASINDRLSSLRAEAVGDALIKQGVPESAITISAFGESDLAVKTADGKVEPRNRRVVIRIVK